MIGSISELRKTRGRLFVVAAINADESEWAAVTKRAWLDRLERLGFDEIEWTTDSRGDLYFESARRSSERPE